MAGEEGSCFVAGTQVVMSDGRRVLIEEVKIGDKLLGMAGSINEVLEFDHPKLGDRSLFSFNNGKPFVTIEHPFMTTDGWKSIDPSVTLEEMPEYKGTKLNEGDTLIKADRLFKLNELESHEADPETQLYNFKLDGNNTYYADGFLVHNKGVFQDLKDTAARMEYDQQRLDAGWTTEQVSSGWGKEKTWSTKWIPPTTQPASTTPAPTGDDTAGTEPEAAAAPTEEDTSDFIYHNMPIDNFKPPTSFEFQRDTTTSGNPYAPSTVSNPLGAAAIPGLNSVIGGDVRTGRTSLGSPSPGQNADGTRGTSPWSPLGINTAQSGLPDFGEGGGYQPKYKVGTNLGGGSNFFGGIQALSMASGAQGGQAQSEFFGGAFDVGADVHGGGEGEGGQTDATTAAGVLGLGVNAVDAMKLGFAITMGMPGLVAVQKALGFELTEDKLGIMSDVAELSKISGLTMTEIAHSIINEDDVFDMPQTIVDFEDYETVAQPSAGTDGGYTPGPSDMSLGTSLHGDETGFGGFGTSTSSSGGSTGGSAGGAGSAGSGTGEGASASGAGAGPHGGDSGGFGGGDGDGGGGGGDGSGCFSADTLFLMEDNTFKRIKDIQVGDEVKGGMVTQVKSGMTGRLWYDYHGTHATDEHFVLERGEWKYVKDADDAVLIDGYDMFYTLNCTNHLLYGVNDQVFSDDAVFDSWGSEKESWDAMLVELNKGLK
jgi:hypothetical protein